MTTAIEALIRRLYPARCRLCGGRGAGDRELCLACYTELPGNLCCCPRCALPVPVAGLCGGCLRKPPPFIAARVPYVYAAPCNFLVARLKFNAEMACARLLGELIADALGRGGGQALDAILPVPLHPRRLRERGFNQSLEMARVPARRLGLSLRPELAWRSRDSTPQRELSAAERRRNMSGVFVADRRVRGLRIAIFDDVVTTGATAMALARSLQRAGAAEVRLWAFARTP